MKTDTMRTYFLLMFLIIAPLSGFGAELTVEQQTAKMQGVRLYNQFKAFSATPLLKIAADAGDPDAQYYLGEAIRKNHRYIDAEAKEAYEDAAKQGSIYSMIRLGQMESDLCATMNNCPKSQKAPKEWLASAKALATAEAAQGNAESMYLLYEITGDKKWLEQSAENGFSLSQYLLANEYREGGGFFLLPSNRMDAVERWMKASAEGGYPRGMSGLAAVLLEKKDPEGARDWTERAAATGYVEAIFNYGYCLAGKNSEFGFSVDFVKSYALLSLFLELDGGGGAKDDAEYVISKIKEKMNQAQLDEADKLATNWKKTHPPLSYFPFKLSR
ncbi:TPR repeat protein [Pseudomonas frederiksbergensis]|uniref:tetratricopeptide repeat protein n=1 Tax=Pseudomonas frederiksbergensis TaxID=104087 RepID=UPI003D1A2CE2